MNDKVRLRFAPSPTGLLHVGNIRTALICWLYAKSHNGALLLRMDDTDFVRSKEEYKEQIKQDLTWLGLDWDEYHEQSKRIHRYDEVCKKLISEGRLYACYETQEDLGLKRKLQLSRGVPPIYDREGLKLSTEEKAKLETSGRKPHWRFKLIDENISWVDEIREEVKFDAANLSDPIIIREDGSYTYMLPSTIDDIDMKITHVVRGEDHINNTAIQIQMFKAISDFVPKFAHVSFVKTKDQEISKRYGGFDIKSLRESGIEPMAINSLFGTIGTSHDIELKESLQDLIKIFDISKYSKSAVYYDVEDLERLNVKYIHTRSFAEVKDKLSHLNFTDIDENFWNAVCVNIKSFAELADWIKICKSDITPDINHEDKDFCSICADLLPQEPWSENTWNNWLDAIKKQSDRKGKSLFMPIRKAITAAESGPELKIMLPLIGYKKVFNRMKGNLS